MAQQTIGIGATGNDGTGDELRTAFDKINDMMTELYSAFGKRPLNAQVGTSYTFVLTDAGKLCTFDNASPVAVTLPENSDVDFDVEAAIDVFVKGAGTVTITADGAATINGASSIVLDGQYAGASLTQETDDVWIAVGRLA
ncbi:hypothetical protein [Mesorhizobium sp. M0239]|uniref:hypothetical protein n=1 Tax=Mesorhizobium sp. M0239 TaxID=2956924 RepID=UPI003338B7F0